MYRAILITLLIVFLSEAASAHPGRTDSQGGHYNRSTGEYHFHNGEYAGKTQSSSNSYYNSVISATLEPYPTARPTAIKSSIQSSVSKITSAESELPVAGKWAIVLGIAVVWLCGILIRSTQNRDYLLNKIKELDNANALLKKELEDSLKKHQSTDVENKRLKSEMRDIAELLTTISIISRERDELERECRSLRLMQSSFSSLYVGMANRITAMQSMITSKQRSELMHYGKIEPPEALVYIFRDKSKKFHTHVHGDWNKYELIPLTEALNKGYEPCQICASRYKNAFRKNAE